MALTFKATAGGGDYKSVPAGAHIAVCNLVADMGVQPGSPAYPDPKRKVYIRFEIPEERVQYEKDGKKIDSPAVVGVSLTASMHEKATLRIRLEGWRGRKFSDEEASNFDVSSILGKPCMLTVVENSVGDKIYSNIASISPMPKGVAAPKAENKLLCYTDDDPSCFDLLPEWLQEKISQQVKPVATSRSAAAPSSLDDGTYITDDDIPF